MIRKGLILSMLTFWLSASLFDIVYYAGGSIVLLTAWIINSIIRKKAEQQLHSYHNS